MTIRFAALLGLFAALTAGCSSTPPQKKDPIDANVTVTLPNGQPARDLTVNLLPTDSGQVQGGGKTDASGKLTSKLTPGKYTFSIEGQPAQMAAVPKKYHQNDAANSFEVPATGPATIELKLTN